MKVPALDQRITDHANAVIAGDDRAAEGFVVQSGLANWRSALAALGEQRPLQEFELLASAKIGQQFIAKTRFHGARGASLLLIRWKEIDGRWMIADAEDIAELEVMVLAAAKDAFNKVSEAQQKMTSSLTGGMKLPGLF